MPKVISDFYAKHPVITIVLAIFLAINLIPLAIVSIKLVIPILLIAGVIAVVRALSSDKLESGAASKSGQLRT
jgi:hypothetical protein